MLQQQTEFLSQDRHEPARSDEGHALPPGLRLLCVGKQQPSWVGLALELDAAGCHDPVLRWVSTGNETLTLLREESFDCLILADAEDTEVLSLLDALRSAGCDDPVLLLVPAAGEELLLAAHHLQAETIATNLGWASRVIVPSVQRAIQRNHLERENHRLAVADRRRLLRDRDEAEQLLHQQRQILRGLEQLAFVDENEPVDATQDDCSIPHGRSRPAQNGELDLPLEFDHYYQELLRTYVIMGSGHLGGEIAKLADLFALAGYGPRQALELHLHRVEQLVSGLGNRSTRHVMSRADLLALELMIHLGESYQRRCHKC